MSIPDYNRVTQMTDAAKSGSLLSEADVDWLLSAAGDIPASNVPNIVQRRAMHVAGVFTNAKLSQLPHTRLPQIYRFAARLATASGQGILPLYTWMGCEILGDLRDKNAVPILKPYLSSADPETRLFAQKALLKISSGS